MSRAAIESKTTATSVLGSLSISSGSSESPARSPGEDWKMPLTNAEMLEKVLRQIRDNTLEVLHLGVTVSRDYLSYGYGDLGMYVQPSSSISDSGPVSEYLSVISVYEQRIEEVYRRESSVKGVQESKDLQSTNHIVRMNAQKSLTYNNGLLKKAREDLKTSEEQLKAAREKFKKTSLKLVVPTQEIALPNGKFAKIVFEKEGQSKIKIFDQKSEEKCLRELDLGVRKVYFDDFDQYEKEFGFTLGAFPDGRIVVVRSGMGVIAQIWCTETGKCLNTFSVENLVRRSIVAVLPNEWIVIVGYDAPDRKSGFGNHDYLILLNSKTGATHRLNTHYFDGKNNRGSGFPSCIDALEIASDGSSMNIYMMNFCYGNTRNKVVTTLRFPVILNPESIQALIEALKINYSVIDIKNNGDTIHSAQALQLETLVKRNQRLKEKQATNPKFNLLHMMASEGDLETVRLLLQVDHTDVDAVCSLTKNALHYAVINRHAEVVQLLASRVDDINVQDADGSTALHEAAIRGFRDIVEILLKHKANTTVTNRAGQTPLTAVETMPAQNRKTVHDRIITLLKDVGKDETESLRRRLAEQEAALHQQREIISSQQRTIEALQRQLTDRESEMRAQQQEIDRLSGRTHDLETVVGDIQEDRMQESQHSGPFQPLGGAVQSMSRTDRVQMLARTQSVSSDTDAAGLRVASALAASMPMIASTSTASSSQSSSPAVFGVSISVVKRQESFSA